MTEDETVRWHHRLNGHEFEQTLEIVKDREVCCAVVLRVTESDKTATEQEQQILIEMTN